MHWSKYVKPMLKAVAFVRNKEMSMVEYDPRVWCNAVKHVSIRPQ